MRVNGRYFEDELKTPSFPGGSRLSVSLSRSDVATFGHDAQAQTMLIAPLAARLQEKLSRSAGAPAWTGTDADNPKANSAITI